MPAEAPRAVLDFSAPLKEHQLALTFHEKVIEHLGIQIYQSPVNAIAEMVANAWDAEAIGGPVMNEVRALAAVE